MTAPQLKELMEDFNQKLKRIEEQDKYAIFETNELDPLNAKVNKMQVEITQKTLELSQHQDTQVDSLIQEIKRSQESLESIQ